MGKENFKTDLDLLEERKKKEDLRKKQSEEWKPISYFFEQNHEADRLKREQEERAKPMSYFLSQNQQSNNLGEQVLKTKQVKKTTRERKKIKKKKVGKIFVSLASAATLMAGAAYTGSLYYKAFLGQNKIVEIISKLYPTGAFTYQDISDPETDISKVGGPALMRFAPPNAHMEPEQCNYEEACKIMEDVKYTIIGAGYPEEWTPVYIAATMGTNRYNDSFKGGSNLDMFNTKLEAYDMYVVGKDNQKEGISR